MNKASFAACLRQVREQAALSQYELAKRTGLTRQAISQLEMGQSEPTWMTVQFLAVALGVDYSAFADSALKLPNAAPTKPRGRPRRQSDRVDSPLTAKGRKAKGKPAADS